MTRLLTAAQMREVDRVAIQDFGLPGQVLMENAGRGVAHVILCEAKRRWPKRTHIVRVICGGGQNGGDGFVVARTLLLNAMDAQVICAVSPTKLIGDAKTFFNVWQALAPNGTLDLSATSDESEWQKALLGADIIVDAIFGTGLRAPPEGAALAAICAINASTALKVCVDLPSGIEADTGRECGSAVKADMTVTIACPKQGLWLDARAAVGRIEVVDFGVSPSAVISRGKIKGPFCWLLDETYISPRLPGRGPADHKGRAGHLLVIAGSVGKTGAALLAGRAALRAGAGLVTLASTAAGQRALDAKVVAEMTAVFTDGDDAKTESYDVLLSLAASMRATIVGPGIPQGPGMQALLVQLVCSWPLPLVIDAGALTLLGTSLAALARQAPAPRILTPHPGEMGRLLGIPASEVEADRLGNARSFSHAAQSIVILKGARTIVALPTGEAFINPHANPSLGTAGTGDVLTGVIGAFVTQGLSAADAACAAVFVHGLSAELAANDLRTRHLIASDLPEAIGRACEQLRSV